VRNKPALWHLYLTAKEFNTRPSALVGLQRDEYAAYCLDNAAADFGRAIESALSEVEGKNKKVIKVKTDRVLRKWLGLPAQYRDPVRSGHAPLQTPTDDGEGEG
jgi:hypothetical protein